MGSRKLLILRPGAQERERSLCWSYRQHHGQDSLLGRRQNPAATVLASSLCPSRAIPCPFPSSSVPSRGWPIWAAAHQTPCLLPSSWVQPWEALVGDRRVGKERPEYLFLWLPPCGVTTSRLLLWDEGHPSQS